MNRHQQNSLKLPFVPRNLLQFFHRATKREKVIFTTLSITACVLLTVFSAIPIWFALFFMTNVVLVCLVLFTLWEDFGGVRYFVIPLLPLLYTQAFLLAMLVIPMHPLLTFLIVGVFGIGMYLILLISNIFNIAAVKTIPLMRAAHAASFSLSILIVFLFIFFAFSLKLHPLILFFLAFGLTIWPSFYVFWSISLPSELTTRDFLIPFIITIITAELAAIMGFWPASPLLISLFVTTIFYTCIGILQQYSQKRLQPKIVAEYIVVLLFIFCLLLFRAQWGG